MSENNKIEWQDMTTTENMEGMQEVVKAITQLQEILKIYWGNIIIMIPHQLYMLYLILVKHVIM